MNARAFSPVLLFLSTELLVVLAASANEVQTVVIDGKSIKQEIAQERFVISGQVENRLPVDVSNVVVRCYMPGMDEPAAQHWESTVAKLAADDKTRFFFSFDPLTVARHRTFGIQLWRFELSTDDPEKILEVVARAEPLVLAAATRALARSQRFEWELVGDTRPDRAGLDRLCVMEAALSKETPVALQYVVERALSGRKVVDRGLLVAISGLAEIRSLPGPFPRLAAWKPGDTPRDEAAQLLAQYPALRVPTLVWMRHAGSGEARSFAEDQLTALHMETVHAQFAADDPRSRRVLERTYLELSLQFPADSQLRHALAVAEFRNAFWFLVLAVATAFVPPCVWGGRERLVSIIGEFLGIERLR